MQDSAPLDVVRTGVSHEVKSQTPRSKHSPPHGHSPPCGHSPPDEHLQIPTQSLLRAQHAGGGRGSFSSYKPLEWSAEVELSTHLIIPCSEAGNNDEFLLFSPQIPRHLMSSHSSNASQKLQNETHFREAENWVWRTAPAEAAQTKVKNRSPQSSLFLCWLRHSLLWPN